MTGTAKGGDNMEKREYKTIRIHPNDYVRLKRLAFFRDKKIVDIVSEATELVLKKYNKNWKE